MPEFNVWFPDSLWGTTVVNAKAFGAIGNGLANRLSTLGFTSTANAQAGIGGNGIAYPKCTDYTVDSADWCGIQAAVDYALENDILNVVVPDGKYYVTDTIHLGYGWIGGAANFNSVVLNGTGYGTASAAGGHLTPGTWIFAFFATQNRPVINIQGGRKSGVRHLAISNDVTVPTPEGESMAFRATKANYIPAGAQDTQNTPFCGVCIDGYSGTPAPASPYPTPRYPTFVGTPASPYGAALSSEWFVEKCLIMYTNIGVMCQPYQDSNGDFGKVTGCQLERLKIAVCVGNSQARSMDFTNCNIFCVHTFIDNASHGHGVGNLQGNYSNIHMGHVWRVIHGTGGWSHSVYFNSLYAEVLGIIGDFAGVQVTFESCEFDTQDIGWTGAAITEWRNEPIFKGNGEFRNCNFEYRTVYQFEGRSTFHNCSFLATGTPSLAELTTAGFAGMAKALTATGRVVMSLSHPEAMLPGPFSGSNTFIARRPDGGTPSSWPNHGYNDSAGQTLWSNGQADGAYTYDYDTFPIARYHIISGTWGTLSGITRTLDSYDMTGRHEVGDIIWAENLAFYAVESINVDGHTLTLKALTHFKMESGTYSMLSLYGEEAWHDVPGSPPTNYAGSGIENIYWFPIGSLDLMSYTASANGIFMKTTVGEPTISLVDYADAPVATAGLGLTVTSKPLYIGFETEKRANTYPFPKWTFIDTIGTNTLTMSQNALVSGTWAYGPGIKRLLPAVPAPVLGVYTFSTLPASPVQGQVAFITDAALTTYHTTAAGSGSGKTTVFYDGTNWLVG